MSAREVWLLNGLRTVEPNVCSWCPLPSDCLWPMVSLRERLLSYPKVTDRSTAGAGPGPGDPAGRLGPRTSAWLCLVSRRESVGLLSVIPLELERSTVRCSIRHVLARAGLPFRARQDMSDRTPSTRRLGRPLPQKPERKPHSPAMVISSMSIDPVRIPPRTSMSDPTSTIFWYMSFRLPAIVTSCTGYVRRPSSTQKPAAPRE